MGKDIRGRSPEGGNDVTNRLKLAEDKKQSTLDNWRVVFAAQKTAQIELERSELGQKVRELKAAADMAWEEAQVANVEAVGIEAEERLSQKEAN